MHTNNPGTIYPTTCGIWTQSPAGSHSSTAHTVGISIIFSSSIEHVIRRGQVSHATAASSTKSLGEWRDDVTFGGWLTCPQHWAAVYAEPVQRLGRQCQRRQGLCSAALNSIPRNLVRLWHCGFPLAGTPWVIGTSQQEGHLVREKLCYSSPIIFPRSFGIRQTVILLEHLFCDIFEVYCGHITFYKLLQFAVLLYIF